MNDILTRAAAIKELIESGGYEGSVQPVGEALVSICNELVESGEAELAITLVHTAAKVPAVTGGSWALRLGVVHARALTVVGKFEQSLNLLRTLSQAYRDALLGNPDD